MIVFSKIESSNISSSSANCFYCPKKALLRIVPDREMVEEGEFYICAECVSKKMAICIDDLHSGKGAQ